jgi:hypothetical protein
MRFQQGRHARVMFALQNGRYKRLRLAFQRQRPLWIGLTETLENDGKPVEAEQNEEVDVLNHLILHQGLKRVKP